MIILVEAYNTSQLCWDPIIDWRSYYGLFGLQSPTQIIVGKIGLPSPITVHDPASGW